MLLRAVPVEVPVRVFESKRKECFLDVSSFIMHFLGMGYEEAAAWVSKMQAYTSGIITYSQLLVPLYAFEDERYATCDHNKACWHTVGEEKLVLLTHVGACVAVNICVYLKVDQAAIDGMKRFVAGHAQGSSKLSDRDVYWKMVRLFSFIFRLSSY